MRPDVCDVAAARCPQQYTGADSRHGSCLQLQHKGVSQYPPERRSWGCCIMLCSFTRARGDKRHAALGQTIEYNIVRVSSLLRQPEATQAAC